MEELYITLKCRDCENTDCTIYPCGIFLTDEDERGCTRCLSEEDYAKFEHYSTEVMPFLSMNKSKESISRTYNEILDFLYYIYSQPVGQKLSRKGKASPIL